MDLDTITVADFKAQFARNFPFLPVYDDEKLYNAGNRVYYADNELFYDCVLDGALDQDPTDGDYWVQVADNIENYVTDTDITNAFAETKVTFNQALFGSDDEIKLGFLYMAAHFLVNDLKAAMGGIYGNGTTGMVTSRSVGNVAESYGIPMMYLEDPLYAFYAQSPYGLKFLAMVIPRIRGNVGVVCGATLP